MSLAFYDRLGAEGLAARTTAGWDRQIITRLREMIVARQRVLDVGCGYGRIAIPLSEAGLHVTGLDLSDVLLRCARERAEATGKSIEWICASMCNMPLPDNSFDVILCLWSAFHELLEEVEQVAAAKEMHRVLRTGGWCLIEGPVYAPASADEIASGKRYGRNNRISRDIVAGLPNPHYCHDRQSVQRIMARAEIASFSVYMAEWAGRQRQFVRFDKDRREI